MELQLNSTPTLQQILEVVQVKPVSVFSYGSRVYQTHDQNSDWDYIVVSEQVTEPQDFHDSDSLSISLLPVFEFQDRLERHEISALECFFLPSELVLINCHQYNWQLNLQSLRHSISEKVSHAWVKAKKKLIILQDYEPHVAKKSLFHALRIANFGIQIAQHQKIIDYTAANDWWCKIKEAPVDWTDLDRSFRPIKNQLLTEFRALASK